MSFEIDSSLGKVHQHILPGSLQNDPDLLFARGNELCESALATARGDYLFRPEAKPQLSQKDLYSEAENCFSRAAKAKSLNGDSAEKPLTKLSDVLLHEVALSGSDAERKAYLGKAEDVARQLTETYSPNKYTVNREFENYGKILYREGKFPEAEQAFRGALKESEKMLLNSMGYNIAFYKDVDFEHLKMRKNPYVTDGYVADKSEDVLKNFAQLAICLKEQNKDSANDADSVRIEKELSEALNKFDKSGKGNVLLEFSKTSPSELMKLVPNDY